MGTPLVDVTSHVEQLRQLAGRIYHAVEAYAHGEVADTNEIVKQCQILQHRAEDPEVFAARLRYQPLDLCALMIAVEGGMLQALTSRGEEETTADQLEEITNRPKSDIGESGQAKSPYRNRVWGIRLIRLISSHAAPSDGDWSM
jgi:hypothetical protein